MSRKKLLLVLLAIVISVFQQICAEVVLRKPDFTLHQFFSREAAFGPGLSEHGLWGYFMYVNPISACSRLEPAPSSHNGTHWIALISRDNCSFVDKIIHAQQAGYVAAIVHNVNSDHVMTMRGGPDSYGVKIPSVFIGHRSAKHLIPFSSWKNVTLGLTEDEDKNSFAYYLVPCAIMLGVCAVALSVVVMARCSVDRLRQRRRRLPTNKVKRIPTKKFKKGTAADVCSVCLDDYEEGDKLRVLPCEHEYHQKCIDPWLIANSRLCPLCKRRVFSSDESDSESVLDLIHALRAEELNDERTPLLLGGRSRRHRERRGGASRAAATGNNNNRTSQIRNHDQQATAQVHTQPLLSSPSSQFADTSDQPTPSMLRRSSHIPYAPAVLVAPSSEEGAVGGIPEEDFQGVVVAEDKRKKEKKRSQRQRSQNLDEIVGLNFDAANFCDAHFANIATEPAAAATAAASADVAGDSSGSRNQDSAGAEGFDESIKLINQKSRVKKNKGKRKSKTMSFFPAEDMDSVPVRNNPGSVQNDKDDDGNGADC